MQDLGVHIERTEKKLEWLPIVRHGKCIKQRKHVNIFKLGLVNWVMWDAIIDFVIFHKLFYLFVPKMPHPYDMNDSIYNTIIVRFDIMTVWVVL